MSELTGRRVVKVVVSPATAPQNQNYPKPGKKLNLTREDGGFIYLDYPSTRKASFETISEFDADSPCFLGAAAQITSLAAISGGLQGKSDYPQQRRVAAP